MNLDLFDSASTVGTGANAAAAAAFSAPALHSDIPGPILALERAYRGEIELHAQIAQRLTDLNAILDESGFAKFTAIDIENIGGPVRQGVLLSYVARVQRYASHALSREGSPFTGELQATDFVDDADTLYRQLVADRPKVRPTASEVYDLYSPIALWREVSKLFDPEAQRRAANAKAAQCIRSEFGLSDRRGVAPDMKLVKGRIEVLLSVYCTTRFNGDRQLSHVSKLGELGDALQQAMVDTGINATFGTALASLAAQIHEFSHRPIVSRERVDLGDGVDVVMGYETFKLYLPQEFASAVNMFLAEYPDE